MSDRLDRVWVGQVRYTAPVRQWLQASDHYIGNAPPGCLYAVGVQESARGLCGLEVGVGPLLGLCLVSRPVARMLPQDGSMGEVTRLWLDPRPRPPARGLRRRNPEQLRLGKLTSSSDAQPLVTCCFPP